MSSETLIAIVSTGHNEFWLPVAACTIVQETNVGAGLSSPLECYMGIVAKTCHKEDVLRGCVDLKDSLHSHERIVQRESAKRAYGRSRQYTFTLLRAHEDVDDGHKNISNKYENT